MSHITVHNESCIATVHSSNAHFVTESVKHLAAVLRIIQPSEQLKMLVRLESHIAKKEHLRYLAVVSSRPASKPRSPSEAFLNAPVLENQSVPEEYCILGIDVPFNGQLPMTRSGSPSSPTSPQKTQRSNSAVSPEQHQGIGSRIASKTRKFLTLPKQKSQPKLMTPSVSPRTGKRPSITSTFRLNEIPNMDSQEHPTKAYIGLVVPIYEDTKICLDGDGGFRVENGDRQHTFKPMSVQAMWSVLQILLKAHEIAKHHRLCAPNSAAVLHRVSVCSASTTTTMSVQAGTVNFSIGPSGSDVIQSTTTSLLQTTYENFTRTFGGNVERNEGSHLWIQYYVAKIDSKWIQEWHLPSDDLRDDNGGRPLSPQMSRHRQRDYSDLEKRIRNCLRDVMFRVDLEQVNSKEIRKRVEETLQLDLSNHKSFIDHEILVILGQMDSASEIFDYLYLGTEWNASNLEELREKGIGLVLNITTEITNSFPQSFDYRNIRVNDEEDEIMIHHWEDAIRYITEAKQTGQKVLVHCKMGVSRSASVVIAYVMKANDWSAEKALEYVKAKRPCVEPNPGFMKQLEVYQGILEASKHRSSWQSASISGSTLSLCETKPPQYSELDAIASSNLRRTSSEFFSAPNLSQKVPQRSESVKQSSRPTTFYIESSTSSFSSSSTSSCSSSSTTSHSTRKKSKKEKRSVKWEKIDEVPVKDDLSPTDDVFGLMSIVKDVVETKESHEQKVASIKAAEKTSSVKASESSAQKTARSVSLSTESTNAARNFLNQLKSTSRSVKCRQTSSSVVAKENRYNRTRPASVHVSTYLKPREPVQTLVKYFDELTNNPAPQPQAAQV